MVSQKLKRKVKNEIAKRDFRKTASLAFDAAFIALLSIAGFSLLGFFISLRHNTTSITNVSFAVLAALSGLCFNYARAIDGDDKHKPYVLDAGVHLFYASTLFLIASLLKYAYIDFMKNDLLASLYNSMNLELSFVGCCLYSLIKYTLLIAFYISSFGAFTMCFDGIFIMHGTLKYKALQYRKIRWNS